MLKKILVFLLAAVMLAGNAPVRAAAEAAPGGGQTEESQISEWTVLFYFCGADLESKHGMASENIAEILCCMMPTVEDETGVLGESDAGKAWLSSDRKVNILIQTGGSASWNLGRQIRADRLQRWSVEFNNRSMIADIQLEEEQPLASMADPATLTDFIRWGKEKCPAKKTALVLWGHGEGAKKGILYDELFEGDTMRLSELKQALRDGGVFFEAVVLDACLMASIETADALKDSAAYMIASEEIVPGAGTDVRGWLQELLYQPEKDGARLGRDICDLTMIQFADEVNEEARQILTWSVTDLSKIDRVVRDFEILARSATYFLERDPMKVSAFLSAIFETETYGDKKEGMRDLASIFYHWESLYSVDLHWRNEILEAITDAVIYCVRGTGRSEARGLSFCFGTDFSAEELEIYAKNCGMPYYLAFLDAIYDTWAAPEWVYAGIERPQELADLADYTIRFQKQWNADQVPGLSFDAADYRYSAVNYHLYREEETTGRMIHMGYTLCRAPQTGKETDLWCAEEFWWWPAVEGKLLDIEMISRTGIRSFYNVPLQVGEEVWYLRYRRDYNLYPDSVAEASKAKEKYGSEYQVYGLWEGYDEDSEFLGRNVIPLAQKAGKEYHILFRVGLAPDFHGYLRGTRGVLPRSMEIEKQLLEPGTYYLQYEIKDLFNRSILIEPLKLQWDGTQIIYPEGFSWEGEMTARWSGHGSVLETAVTNPVF